MLLLMLTEREGRLSSRCRRFTHTDHLPRPLPIGARDRSCVPRHRNRRSPQRQNRRKRRCFKPALTHCCGTNQQGKFQVVRLTAKKRMRATLTAIRDKLCQRRHEPVPIVGAWLQRVLNGCFAYHAVPTNLLRLDGFRDEVCRAWRHALLRRSQRHRLWARFNRLTRKYVPPCRVLHPYPEKRFFASRTLGRSSMR